MAEQSMIEPTQETVEEVTNEVPTGEENTEAVETASEESPEQELVFGKYKDIDAAQDAFKTLESENGRLRREKSPTAPDEYAFDFADDADVKDIYGEHDFSNDPMAQAILPVFKEANLTQDQANAVIKAYGLHEKSKMVDFDAEVAKVDGGMETVSQVESFVQKNFTSSEQGILASIATSAEGLMFIKNHMMKAKAMPGTEVNTVTESSDDLIAKAMEIKKSDNFSMNTNALARYEALMDKAMAMQMKGL